MIRMPKFILLILKNFLASFSKTTKNKDYPEHGIYNERLNIPYLDDNEYHHQFDIYYAKEPIKNAVIIDIHGGAYMFGQHEDNYYFGTEFLARGYDFICIDYLPNDGKRQIKDLVDDCALCLMYIFNHMVELGLSGKKIILTGDSAGGHFALLLAEAINDKQLALELGYEFRDDIDLIAVMLNCPVYDFAVVGRKEMTKASLRRMLGSKYTNAKLMELLSPRTHIDKLKTPLFCSTCRNDFIRKESVTLNEDMRSSITPFLFVDIPSKDMAVGHVHNVLAPSLKESKKVNNLMLKFLEACLLKSRKETKKVE